MKTVQINFQHKQDESFKMISQPFQVTVEMKDYKDEVLQKIACYGILQKLHPNEKMQIISIS